MKYEDGETYHLYNRGAHKAKIFYSEENYGYCLRRLQQFAKSYAVSIVAYCLMPNHYHLLLKQEDKGSISRFIQMTFNAYTQALNKQMNLSGTLFQGRAQARHVDSDEYILQVARYIHINPVVAKLVLAPEQYQFSDYSAWVAKENGSVYRRAYFKSGDEYKRFVLTYLRDVSAQSKMKKYLFGQDALTKT